MEKRVFQTSDSVGYTAVNLSDVPEDGPENITNDGKQKEGILPLDNRSRALKDKTLREIEDIKGGMLRLSCIENITDRINNKQRWITITGNAGEGKTTAGYMVLQNLLEDKKNVFKVDTPEDYFYIMKKIPDCVIMMDDVLGAFAFDHSALSRWESVFHHFIEMNARNRKNKKDEQGFVLFLCRISVVEEARKRLRKYENDMFGDDKIINLSTLSEQQVDERLQLLDYYLQKAGIDDTPREIKVQVASGSCSLGFPHCCKMYVDFKKTRNQHVDIENYFEKPLHFLRETMNILVGKSHFVTLFKEMLKNNGYVVVSKILDEVKRDEVKRAAGELLGNYLKQKEEQIIFAHPTIHESAAICLGQRNPVFAVQHFDLSFMLQKVKFTTGQEILSEENLYIESTDMNIRNLCMRFIPSILGKDFSILRHSVCMREDVCRYLIEHTVEEKGVLKMLTSIFAKKGTTKIDINCKDTYGDTLLHVAFANNNQTAIQVLLRLGADVNVRDKHFPKVGNSFCHLTMMDENVDVSMIDKLVSYGADFNTAFADGKTVIHHMYETSRLDLLEYLLQRGADVNLHDASGKTVLHLMCEEGASADDVKLLFKYDVDVNKSKVFVTHLRERIFGDDTLDVDLSDSDDDPQSIASHLSCLVRGRGKTALHFLCSSFDANKRTLMDILIRHGAKVNNTDNKGRTPLHYACEENALEAMELLVKHAADVNAVDAGGRTAVHQMYSSDNKEGIDLLLEHGANINVTNSEGRTMLHCHCKDDGIDLEFLQKLILHGADINMRKKPTYSISQTSEGGESKLLAIAQDVSKSIKGKGKTALHYLCKRDSSETGSAIKLLLQKGAKVEITDSKGNTPLHYACNTTNDEIFELLLQNTCDANIANGEGDTVLHHTYKHLQTGKLRAILKHGADVNKEDGDGKTLLHYACQSENVDLLLIESLIQAGADVNKQRRYTKTFTKGVSNDGGIISGLATEVGKSVKGGGKTALHYACKRNQPDTAVLEVLLHNGALVNMPDRHGMTSVHYVVANEQSNENILQLLTSYGANVSKINNFGQTPLHLLCKRRHVDAGMLEMLIQHGVDMDVVDKKGCLAFDNLDKANLDEHTREVLARHGMVAVWET